MEKGEQVVVGVNRFAIQNEQAPELLRVDEALGERRRIQVAGYWAARDNGAVRARLEGLAAGAAGSANLMPLILAAVKAEATIGEICGCLRGVFGEYQENLVL